MGTIAELLGYSPFDDDETGRANESPASADVTEDDHHARETVMSAVLAQTGRNPASVHPALDLVAGLDLDELGLYAIVSRIEHELAVTIPDEEVHSWRTLGDILDRIEELAGA